MRLKLAAAIAAALLAGACAKAVVSSNDAHVSIRYDTLLDSPKSLQADADKACAKSGRTAVYRETNTGEGLGLGYAQFDCVKPGG